MKILIITQKIDSSDPVLGFFHNWVLKLAPNFDKVSVICLEKGRFDLPENVRVYSLGKEKGRNIFKYVSRLYMYVLGLATEYDAVFVHMNEEYMVLAGFLWKILRKKVYFWRNHPKGGVFTKIGCLFANKIFATSPKTFVMRYKKAILMPVGVDVEKYKVQSAKLKGENSILSLGRISPIKNIHLMVEAAEILKGKNKEFIFDIMGDPVNKEDFEYREQLNKSGAVNFAAAVANDKAPEIYGSHKIFINMTESGSMDKTIFEAILCGCVPIVANDFFDEIFDREMISRLDAGALASKIEYWLKQGDSRFEEARTRLRKYVLENHSLNALIDGLCTEIRK